MANFFTENSDRLFHFNSLDIKKIVESLEDSFNEHKRFDYAPENYEDAIDNYKKILELVGQISAECIAPLAKSVDEQGASYKDGEVEYAEGTKQAFETLRKADLIGGTLPRKYGGLNLPNVINNIVIEMVSEADASFMNIYGLQDIAVTINKFASEEQKEKILPLFCKGEVTGSMDLTEPEAGSDLQAVQAKATFDEKENCWKLNGVKRFITNGGARVHLVLARSEEGTQDARGLSMFLYLKDGGMKIRRIEHKLGIHGSPTTELEFNDAKCELVGKRRFGLIKYVMHLMNGARLGVAIQALGIAQAAYNKALKYALERKQFGKKIIELPAVYDMLTNDRMDIEATRSLIYHTGLIVDELESIEKTLEEKQENFFSEKPANQRERAKKLSEKVELFTPLAKYYSTEAANRICYNAIQIHGGTGYMQDFDVERYYRDARITSIYEGTTQFQVVAAIGGVMTKQMDSEFEKFRKSAQGHEGEFKDVYDVLLKYERMFNKAIDKVRELKNKDFRDYIARTLIDMALLLYMSYSFLDEAKRNPKKALFARKFAMERLPGFESNYHKVMEVDETTIRNYEQLLEIKI
ncbi:MAG: acyl-CoA dehydrogenase family protein [bacterium]